MPAVEPPSSAVRVQAGWLLLFLGVALGVALMTDALARNRALEYAITARSSALSAQNGKLFSNNGSFIDYEERIILDELPNTDFTRGGIYFFGSSNMKWAFTTWDLPDALRTRLGNYGTGGAAHATVLRLVRYLIDTGRISAGNGSEVILGVSYHLGHPEFADSYFPALVRRQGFYRITADDRLVDAPVSPLWRWWVTEKARSGGFIRNVGRLLNNWALALFGLSHQPPHDGDFYRRTWAEFMGPDWRHTTDDQLVRFSQTLALLRAHNVPVKVILLPQGSWMNALPYGRYYDARLQELAKAGGAPVLDWSNTLPDSDFIDSNHLTHDGQTKFRSMMLKQEAEHLRRLGVTALPQENR